MSKQIKKLNMSEKDYFTKAKDMQKKREEYEYVIREKAREQQVVDSGSESEIDELWLLTIKSIKRCSTLCYAKHTQSLGRQSKSIVIVVKDESVHVSESLVAQYPLVSLADRNRRGALTCSKFNLEEVGRI